MKVLKHCLMNHVEFLVVCRVSKPMPTFSLLSIVTAVASAALLLMRLILSAMSLGLVIKVSLDYLQMFRRLILRH